MMERKALIKTFDNSDRHFFVEHPERQAHIRLPYKGESEGEFWSLGEHDRAHRRIILWRIPKDNPYFEQSRQGLLKIPLIDPGTFVDSDEELLPYIHSLMEQAQGAS